MAKSKESKKIGRPSIYTPELAEDICLTLRNSTDMLETLCEKNPHWPCAQTIYEWRILHESFGEMYVRAKQSQIEPLVSGILKKVRDKTLDFIENSDGDLIPNTPHLTRLKIEVDATKWLAGKLCPRLYGERSQEKEAANNNDHPELKELTEQYLHDEKKKRKTR